MNNPLPRWWVWMFMLITVVFAILYLVLYPGLGDKPGTLELDFRRRARCRREASSRIRTAPLYARLHGHAGPPTSRKDAQAMAIGESVCS